MNRILLFILTAALALAQIPQPLKVNPSTGAIVDPVSGATFTSGNGLATATSVTSEAATRATADSTNAAAITSETSRATAAEALKANIASPTLTGIPSAPTAAANTNTAQIASTGYVHADVNAARKGAAMALSSFVTSIPLQIRLQTHNGNGVPIGIYQDAAMTTPAVNEGDPVRAFKDVLGGSGLSITINTSDPSATLRFFDGRPGIVLDGRQGWVSTSQAWYAGKRGCIYVLFRNLGYNAPFYVAGTFTQGGTNTFFIESAIQGTNNVYYDGTFRTGSNYQQGIVSAAYSRNSDTNLAIYQNGSFVENVTVANQQPDVSKLTIGSATTGGLTAGVLYAFFYSTSEVISPQISDLMANLATADVSVVCDGDSLTQGGGLSNASSYPGQLQVLLRAGNHPTDLVQNIGIGGQITSAMTSKAAAQIDAAWGTQTRKIVACWCGTNDLFFGASAATTYSRMVAYYTARKAAGEKVIAFTILPRSDAGTPGTFEADRQTVNTSLRANWATYADALCDVAADSRIGDAGDELNTTYYQSDHVHLNTTGFGIPAALSKSAIDSIAP